MEGLRCNVGRVLRREACSKAPECTADIAESRGCRWNARRGARCGLAESRKASRSCWERSNTACYVGKGELLGRDSAHSAFRGCSATHRSRTRVLQRATFKKPIQKYDLRAPFLAAHLEKHLEDVVAEGILHELAQTALQLLEDLRHHGGARGQQDLLQGATAVVVLGHFHHVAAQAFELDLLAVRVGPRLGFGLGFGLRSGRDGALGLGLGLGLEVVGGLGVLAGSALGLSVAVAVAFSGSEAAARDPLARGARRGLELRGRAGHGRTGRAMPSGSIGVARRIGSIQNTRCDRFVRFGGS